MSRFPRLCAMAGAVALLLGSPSSGTAEVAPPKAALGTNFRISGPRATADDFWAAAAWNETANQYLVVWRDGRNEGISGADIYGQRLAADGRRIGSNFRISGPGATADERHPAVAWNRTSNRYLVVWSDGRNDGTSGTDIYGQILGPAGGTVGSNFRISGPGAEADEGSPAVAWNAKANRYLVVWVDERSAADHGTDIYGQILGPAGGRVGSNFRISGSDVKADESSPAAAWNAQANRYLVVWEDNRDPVARGLDIYGQILGPAGGRVGSNFRISGPVATDSEYSPAVAWNQTANRYLVVWEDYRNQEPRGTDIYGQILGPAGGRVGSNFRVSGRHATSDECDPAVAWNRTANRYLVVWEDWRSYESRGSDIYGQILGPAGGRVGSNFRVSGPDARLNEYGPAVAWNGTANQYLVVWDDQRDQTPRGSDIYGQRLTG